tara:strand:+ start:3334 stop:4008 length:675 start_codon:yes stop_codon:yes gene_type:complete
MFSFKIFLEIIIGISQNKSLCRILQNYESKQLSIEGDIIEFGAEPNSKNNFSKIIKKKNIKNIFYSDRYLRHKKVIKADLNKKINIKKGSFNYVLLFNVMEHLINIENAKIQISKIICKNGYLIGSTPFLYRFHGAPSDYLRFTKPYLINLFKKDFKIIKMQNLGLGPFCLCFSLISDFTKKIPLLNYFIFTITYIIDLLLNKLVKYELKDIYPIAVYFKLKKK